MTTVLQSHLFFYPQTPHLKVSELQTKLKITLHEASNLAITNICTSRDRFLIQPLGCPLPALPFLAQCITLECFKSHGIVIPEDSPQSEAENEVGTDLEDEVSF